ncbi:hypothetical protein AGMMS50268_37960 [Spirochaetia bacterium]|nr:hypothetical protein AGMMS50268_37960 [Spirochaetia bacterium]
MNGKGCPNSFTGTITKPEHDLKFIDWWSSPFFFLSILKENIFHIGSLKELLLNTITAILGQRSNKNYFKDKIWDIQKSFTFTIERKSIEAYLGIKLSRPNFELLKKE